MFRVKPKTSLGRRKITPTNLSKKRYIKGVKNQYFLIIF